MCHPAAPLWAGSSGRAAREKGASESANGGKSVIARLMQTLYARWRGGRHPCRSSQPHCVARGSDEVVRKIIAHARHATEPPRSVSSRSARKVPTSPEPPTIAPIVLRDRARSNRRSTHLAPNSASAGRHPRTQCALTASPFPRQRRSSGGSCQSTERLQSSVLRHRNVASVGVNPLEVPIHRRIPPNQMCVVPMRPMSVA
jgi:hypothetical protein